MKGDRSASGKRYDARVLPILNRMIRAIYGAGLKMVLARWAGNDNGGGASQPPRSDRLGGLVVVTSERGIGRWTGCSHMDRLGRADAGQRRGIYRESRWTD